MCKETRQINLGRSTRDSGLFLHPFDQIISDFWIRSQRERLANSRPWYKILGIDVHRFESWDCFAEYTHFATHVGSFGRYSSP
jgi:hypothetical protein